MKAITFIPSADTDRMIWLTNFSLKITTYAPILGVTSAEVTSLQKDAVAFSYIMNMQEHFKQSLQSITAYKSLMKHAVNQQHLGTIPVIPSLPTPPPAVPEGVFDRASKLAQRIKASPNYTSGIGSDLGIISPSSKTDTSALKPNLKLYLDAGHPHIKCSKGIADALDLYVDRKDNLGFVLLGRFLIFDYVDKVTLPNDSTLAEWDYKAIYVIGNDKVGLMSSISSIVVKKV
jgi:hypothetical protein